MLSLLGMESPMLDAFSVVVPALDRRMSGIMRPVEAPSTGTLLLDGTGPQAPLVARIFAELELYFQAANIFTLRLSIPPHAPVVKRVSSVLGGVSLLRSAGVARVLIITSTPNPRCSGAAGRASAFAEFMRLADQRRPLPDIVQVVRDLTTAIRDVADSTAGVATLLVPPQSTPDVSTVKASPRRTPRRAWSPGRVEDGMPPSPPALLLPMPSARDDATGRRAVAPLLTQLYSWSLALAHRDDPLGVTDNGSPSRPALTADQPAASLASDQSEWSQRLRWADAEWAALVRECAARAPALAAHLQAARPLAGGQPGASLRAARAVWPLLDYEARTAWLRVSAALFA